MAPYSRGGRGGYPLVDLELALAPRRGPNPLVVLWRWRYELAALVTAAILLPVAIRTGHLVLLMATAAGVAVTVIAWPGARRYLQTRLWCVVTPHRVRTACAEAWIHSRSGNIPIVVWTTPRPYGERVVLWCRAGTTVHQLEEQQGMLATACWARTVLLVQHRRYPQLVFLDVFRYDDTATVSGRAPAPEDLDAGTDDEPMRLVHPPAAS
jgi:hypothetical protein